LDVKELRQIKRQKISRMRVNIPKYSKKFRGINFKTSYVRSNILTHNPKNTCPNLRLLRNIIRM
jgi:hypothetical protein